jgi:hypothetical protein
VTSIDVTSERAARLSERGYCAVPRNGQRRQAAFCHGFCHINIPIARYFGHGGDDAMHFANYIVLGLLIACMLGAAGAVFSQRKS